MSGYRQGKIISKLSEAKEVPLSQIPQRPEPSQILMCDPSYFQVVDVKNRFMEGNIGAVNTSAAKQQWHSLKQKFEGLGYTVQVIPAQPGLEDMVFTANQVLLGSTSAGKRYVLLSRMVHPSRQKEVKFFAEWFGNRNYTILELPLEESCHFEGHGDAIWHPNKQLLWGGWGQRTDLRAYEIITDLLDIPITTLHLRHPSFYHLDTAFCPLDQETAMFYPQAFDEEGIALIAHFFPRLIKVNEMEAYKFACNALPLGRKVVIQAGCSQTNSFLKELGLEPEEVATSEFLKSGGSVSCLKMLVY